MKLIPENHLQVSHHSTVSLIVNLATKQNKGTPTLLCRGEKKWHSAYISALLNQGWEPVL